MLDGEFGTGPHDHPRLTGNQRRGWGLAFAVHDELGVYAGRFFVPVA